MPITSKKRNNVYIPESGYYLLDQTYTSSDELNKAVRGWDIDLNQLEAELIRQALSLAGGNKSRAARLLGLTRDTLLYRIHKHLIPA